MCEVLSGLGRWFDETDTEAEGVDDFVSSTHASSLDCKSEMRAAIFKSFGMVVEDDLGAGDLNISSISRSEDWEALGNADFDSQLELSHAVRCSFFCSALLLLTTSWPQAASTSRPNIIQTRKLE
jgi:hypothetical protein